MLKEIAGGYNCDSNKNEKKSEFTKHESITQTKFKEIIGSKLEDPEKVLERWVKNLKNSLKKISKKTNSEYNVAINNEGEERNTTLLNEDGTIRMNAFSIGEGGPYKKEDKSDKEYIEYLEKEWEEEEGWSEEKKEKNFGELWEKAKTVILNKVIGSEFIVARASKYDDYKNKVDNVIVDGENIVCAFDEVSAEKGTEKEAEKSEKVERKNEKGGATIKYGITVNEEKQIIKKEIKNIPVFYLRLSGRDLVKLLHRMDYESKEPSEIELNVFDDLIDSLKEQLEELENKEISENKNKEEVEAMRANAKKFADSLNRMEELRKDFNVANK